MVDSKCGPIFCVITVMTSAFLNKRKSELNFLLNIYIFGFIETKYIFYNIKQLQQKYDQTINIEISFEP